MGLEDVEESSCDEVETLASDILASRRDCNSLHTFCIDGLWRFFGLCKLIEVDVPDWDIDTGPFAAEYHFSDPPDAELSMHWHNENDVNAVAPFTTNAFFRSLNMTGVVALHLRHVIGTAGSPILWDDETLIVLLKAFPNVEQVSLWSSGEDVSGDVLFTIVLGKPIERPLCYELSLPRLTTLAIYGTSCTPLELQETLPVVLEMRSELCPQKALQTLLLYRLGDKVNTKFIEELQGIVPHVRCNDD